MNNSNTKTFAGWFLPGLALLFIGLKLTGHITWSWWWVLSPLWLPFAVGIAIAVVAVIFVIGYNALVSKGK